MWFLAGGDVTINVDFLDQGVPTVPDPDSVTYTVYGNAGQPIVGLASVPITVEGTSAAIVVPAEHNTLAGDSIQEARYVVVAYAASAKPRNVRVPYRLHAFIPMEVVAADVRNELGLAPNELPDEDVDLVAAYLRVKADYPEVATSLTATSLASLNANRAIALRAAIDVLPSLRLRLAQVDRTENSTFQRFNGKWEDLRADLEARFRDAVVGASPTEAAGTTNLQAIFMVTTPIDPVTNA